MRIFLRYASLTLLACGLASCGSGDTPESKGDSAVQNGGITMGGTFRMNEVQEIRTLDPVRMNDAPSHHIAHQIYDMLVDFDSSLTLQPELAERWEVSPDGLTYTYHLRKGVMFHDNACFPGGKGRELKASDVKFTFDRILDARSGTFGDSYFRGKVKGATEYYQATQKGNAPAEGVSGFRVVDDYTFAIDLLKPFAAFKYYPALGFCYIYPKEAVEKYGKDFFRNPVGTGPFVFEKWSPGQELTLKKNPSYWGTDAAGNKLPYMDGFRLSFLKDEKQQINEFTSGNLEESYRIPSEFFGQIIDAATGQPTPEYAKFRIHRVPALSTQFYGFNTTAAPFSDKRVRQAFNLAIDRKKIITYVLQGQAAGPGVHGLVPGSMPGYAANNIKGYDFDLQKAKSLMAEAGFPNGQGFPAMTLNLNSGGGRNQEVAEAMTEMLNKGLGINVTMQILEWPQHQELLETGKAPFWRLGWITDYPDPENFLNLFYGPNIPASGPSPINSTRYANPTFDSLFAIALGTQDDAQRMALYAQAEQLAIDDAPMIMIYHDLDYRLVQPWVHNYSSNPMDRRDFKAVWLAKH